MEEDETGYEMAPAAEYRRQTGLCAPGNPCYKQAGPSRGRARVNNRRRRVGVIGAGRIGREVIAYLISAPGWMLAGVLCRHATETQAGPAWTDVYTFLAQDFDLVLDLASPAFLAQHGAGVLAMAETWTVNAAALADPAVHDSLDRAARESRHRLRLLWGAISGLDGIATASRDPDMQLHLTLCRPGIGNEPGPVFAGSVREGACRFPAESNVAVAAAINGPGLDRSRLEIISAAPLGPHTLTAVAQSRYGRFTTELALLPHEAMQRHPVAASVIAALEREMRPIWAG